jgi:D-alanyl-D-alanine carboxypeptidase (penicillin-binding protein 5/6)
MYLSKFLSRTGTNADHRLKPVRFLCALVIVILSISMTGCSRGYISSYSDHVRRSSFSPTAMTAVSAEFSGKADLYAEDLAVPGEGKAVDVGSLKASGLFDLEGGKTVVDNDITKKIYPASVTKIMTALLALKYGGDLDQTLTSSARVPDMEWQAQKIGIEKGDKMTLDQALHYLMVYSANDAAVLIAEHVGGSYEGFINMMNEEAARLGATNTHFVNPHGLHDKDHYTTVYDLYLIFQECLKYDTFRELIDISYYSTVFYDKDGGIRAIEVPSTDNYLMGYVDPPNKIKVLGGKTGTTDQAGSCLILLTKNADDREFISVVMGASDGSEVYTCMNRLLRQERGYKEQ